MKLESRLINTFHRVKARAVSFNKANDFYGEKAHSRDAENILVL